jgi:hypothetical protein
MFRTVSDPGLVATWRPPDRKPEPVCVWEARLQHLSVSPLGNYLYADICTY